MFAWLKWWFWETRQCEHEPSEWKKCDGGMSRYKSCKKCLKVLERQ